MSGALLARATAPAALKPGELTLRERVGLGAIAAAFPDIDVVCSFLSPLAYLHHHRGATHSLLLLPLWALLLGVICAWIMKRDFTRWRSCSIVIALGIGAHIAGDLITSFGTMIFAPLSNTRYAWSTTFIIDLWFSGIIVAGLVASALWRSTRVPALIGCCVLVGYVGFQYVQRERAIDFGREFAQATGLKQFEVSAIPRPVSPFNWMVVVAQPESYHYTHISLSRSTPRPPAAADAGFIERLAAPYQPLSAARWDLVQRFGARADERRLAVDAWGQSEFEFFRWFAAFPALYRIDYEQSSQCVWFRDLRFLTPGRARVPFLYGMCRAETDPWRPFELLDSGFPVAVY